ncbi:MAG: hypothetical protein RLZZ405_932 [Verrucomicrobiota bacterium]|jgi:hypothetical protein
MKPRPGTSPVRRFLRGLANTALYLLLPCQLLLLWVVTRDGPVELPALVTRLLEDQVAEAGGRLHARRYLLTPQRTVIAQDVALEVSGLPGEILTAARLEIGLRLTGKNRGLASLRISDGRLWCPATASAHGKRTLLLDQVHADLRHEGRWWQARFQGRAGKFTFTFAGTLPGGMAAAPATPTAAGVETGGALGDALRTAETYLNWADRTGGGSVHLTGAGRADGGVDLEVAALLGDHWIDERIGIVRFTHPSFIAQARLDAQGRPGPWRLAAEARDLESQGRRARAARITAQGEGLDPRAWQAEGRVTEAQAFGFAGVELEAAASGAEQGGRGRVRTATSSAALSWHRLPDGSSQLRCPTATLSGEDLGRIPALRTALTEGGVGLEGSLLLADLDVRCAAETWTVLGASGRTSFGGLRALGLGAETISPGAGSGLNAAFRFDAGAPDFPLVLEQVDLAGVRGEAHCSLRAGGPFRLNLRGELAPPCLDRLLGDWWVRLWGLFRLTARPHAIIEVEGAWGRPLSTTTRGVATLAGFRFMQAPFRSVTVRIDADARRTRIGLERLAGGDREADGAVDGLVTWDWSKPVAQAGPRVHAEGNLQPWIAATIAGAALGDSLKALDLPPTRQLVVDVAPGDGPQPDVTAKVRCAEPFRAWGLESAHLEVTVRSSGPLLGVAADLDLAAGRAHLDLAGDLLRAPEVNLRLTGCDFAKIGALMSELSRPQPAEAGATPTPRNSIARLDLRFSGNVDLRHPTQLRGRGDFLLDDPELKKVRVLGGLSAALEAIGVDATSYELLTARGNFGCLGGKAYFPDLVLAGKDAQLKLAGEVDLAGPTLNFLGDFSLDAQGSFNPLQLLNLNRLLVALTKVRVKGPLANPKTTAFPKLKDVVKSKEDSELGKIPPALSE